MSVLEGQRLLRGAPGTTVQLSVIRGSAADPHDLSITRSVAAAPDITGRVLREGPGYIRIASFGPGVVEQLTAKIGELTKSGASTFVIDLRGAAEGDLDQGVMAARLFVPSGDLVIRAARGAERQTLSATPGDGRITQPVAVLVDAGTAGAAELFAASLASARRADLIGEKTLGRAAVQKLVKLSDGSGLWLSGVQYLTASGAPIQGKGLEPTIEVEGLDVEFGAAPSPGDPVLERAITHLTVRQAA